MPNLPNPFADCNSADVVMPFADTAAAFVDPQVPDAAANQSSSNMGRLQEALAADAADPHETAGAFDYGNECHQTFRRAVLLDEIERHHRFRLDEIAFMEALEEPPLFLRN